MAGFIITRGGKIRNGATVIDYKRSAMYGITALCEWGGSFVSWRIDGNGDAYLGHYHGSDREAAEREFEQR